MRWRDQAECRDAPAELFIITGARTTPHPFADQALAYCRRCPVRQACLDDAITERDTDVVRGGREIRDPVPICSWCKAPFDRTSKRQSRKYCSPACVDAGTVDLANRKAAKSTRQAA